MFNGEVRRTEEIVQHKKCGAQKKLCSVLIELMLNLTKSLISFDLRISVAHNWGRKLQILLKQLLMYLKNQTLNLLENELLAEEWLKKVTITVDDNIIPKPDVALELGKSISLTEATEEKAARQVHATHARIMTERVPSLPEEDH
ncbi:hypothetical protein Tco_0588999 [Tanacetum coccineum]